MRVPTASELLAAWEEGVTLQPAGQAVLLLALVCPERAPADLSLGERDRRLLALREQLFGPRLRSLAACPGCGEQLELDFDVGDLRVPAAQLPPAGGEVAVSEGEYRVRCRLPSSADLLAVSRSADEREARQSLLSRCVVGVERAGVETEAAAAELPAAVVGAVVEQMRRADPQADVQLALDCPACREGWSVAFDIASYLWAEVGDWAQRTLREVHALARAYGWSESDILSMGVRRRRWYMEMIGA